MDSIQTILISSAVTSSLYGILKGGIHIYKNYYLKSTCHENQLTIEVVVTKPDEEEKKQEEEKKDLNSRENAN